MISLSVIAMANGSYGYESSGDGSPEWDESLSQRSMASGEFHPHFRNACHTVLHIGPSRYGSKFLEVASLGSNRNLADDDEEAVANSSPCVCRGDNRGRVRQTPQRGTALGVHWHILGTSLLSHFQVIANCHPGQHVALQPSYDFTPVGIHCLCWQNFVLGIAFCICRAARARGHWTGMAASTLYIGCF